MATKRSLEETEMALTRPRRENAKRTKISSSADRRSDSSNPSIGSVSEDSALQSSDRGSERRSMSSISSVESSDNDDDGDESSDDSGSTMSDGKSSSSVDETDSDEEDGAGEEPVITVGGPKKPRMDHARLLGGARDLQSRLAAFLPQMEKANGLLGSDDKMEKDDNGDEDDDEEQHVEMNLGLGVLEERRHGDEDEEGDDSDMSDESQSQSRTGGQNSKKDQDVIGTLLGNKASRKSVGIEEIG